MAQFDVSFQPGKVALLHEVASGAMTGSVRVVGSVKEQDSVKQTAIIEGRVGEQQPQEQEQRGRGINRKTSSSYANNSGSSKKADNAATRNGAAFGGKGNVNSGDSGSGSSSSTSGTVSLLLDTTKLQPLNLNIDSLYEFIGEVEWLNAQESVDSPRGGGVPMVRVRVCRNVDGMDLHLFEQALKVRRAFMANPVYQQGL